MPFSSLILIPYILIYSRKGSAANAPDFKWLLLKKSELEKLVELLQADIENNVNIEELRNCVGMFGYIMSKPEFTTVLPISDVQNVAKTVLKIAKKEKDRKILVRVLWGFAMEKYPESIYRMFCDELVDIIIDAVHDQQSSVVIYESLRLLSFLVKSFGSLVVEKCIDFYPEVFPRLFHCAPRIRRLALSITGVLLEQPDILEVLSGVVKQFIPKIKETYAGVMSKLVQENCLDALMTWKVCIAILDRQLHVGIALINALLVVIEKGFKSNETVIRVESFMCWISLIENFGMDKSLITTSKRLKLLVAPFMANNAKNEEIAAAKLNAWWQLVSAIGPAASNHFDLVVLPLLRYCFIPTSASSTSPNIARHSKNIITLATPGHMFPKVQPRLIHIFSQLLTAGISSAEASAAMGSFETPIINSAIYTKHYYLIHICFRECLGFICNNDDIAASDICSSMAKSQSSLLDDYIKTNSTKEGSDAAKDFFSALNSVVSMCVVGEPRSKVSLDVLEALVCGTTAIPSAVLQSRHYQAGGAGAGDVMRGTLASSIVDMLLKPALMHESARNKLRYCAFFEFCRIL